MNLFSANGINWEEQWELFAPGFKNGYLPLNLNGKEIRLLAGPGFGDLSHPTTQLMVKYLPEVPLDSVVDVGCGSGILSLAAKALGAKSVTGIDICQESITHAKKNSAFNQMDIEFVLPEQFKASSPKSTILMNMIYSEQQSAWEHLPSLHQIQGDLVLSGLLKSHRKLALSYWNRFGWTFKTSLAKENWLLLHLVKSL